VSEKTYFCEKCGYRHRYSSKIGIKHLQHKIGAPNSSSNILDNENFYHLYKEKDTIVLDRIEKRYSKKRQNFIQRYRQNYKNGVEKYGKWWIVFQLSMWSFVMIFLLTAGIIFFLYLPQVKRITG